MKSLLFGILSVLLPMCIQAQTLSPSYIDEELYDYLPGVGSFYCYEEEFSGSIDSLIVTDLSRDFTPEVYTIGGTYPILEPKEYYLVDYESMTLAYQTWDEFFGYGIIREGEDWGNGQYLFLASYTINDSINNAKIIDTLDTLVINGNTFNHVTKMFISSNSFDNDSPTCYYYAKDVGLIRKEIYLNDTTNIQEIWNLKSWNKIQVSPSYEEEDPNQKDLVIFPNPVDELLTIETTQFPAKVNIIDVNGKIQRTFELNSANKILDVIQLEAGVYFVRIGDHIEKFVKR